MKTKKRAILNQAVFTALVVVEVIAVEFLNPGVLNNIILLFLYLGVIYGSSIVIANKIVPTQRVGTHVHLALKPSEELKMADKTYARYYKKAMKEVGKLSAGNLSDDDQQATVHSIAEDLSTLCSNEMLPIELYNKTIAEPLKLSLEALESERKTADTVQTLLWIGKLKAFATALDDTLSQAISEQLGIEVKRGTTRVMEIVKIAELAIEHH